MFMKVVVAWSGGKDSALALYTLLTYKEYDVKGLLTTFTEDYNRVTMHGVRRELIIYQANALNLPLYEVFIPKNCPNEIYNERMNKILLHLKEEDVEGIVFGDIFLEDVRRYREENLAIVNMKGIFPLWKRDTKTISISFIKLGFKAITVCIDSKKLDKRFSCRIYNNNFLGDLPSDVDLCGENGEFHTFVYDGPIFKTKIDFKVGETVLRDDFYYCDLIPVHEEIK